jgi:hypothetical protein
MHPVEARLHSIISGGGVGTVRPAPDSDRATDDHQTAANHEGVDTLSTSVNAEGASARGQAHVVLRYHPTGAASAQHTEPEGACGVDCNRADRGLEHHTDRALH